MSSGPDRIVTTVGAELDRSSVAQVVRQFATQLKAELQRQLGGATQAGAVPTVTGRGTFTEGGRRFEITGRAKEIEGREGVHESVQMQIREIEEEQLRLDKLQLATNKKRVARARREISARKSAASAAEKFTTSEQVPLEDLEASGVQLQKQIDRANQKRVRQARQQIRVKEKAAREASQFVETTQVPLEYLELNAAQLRKKIDQESQKQAQQAQARFVEDFDIAQSQVKFNEKQKQASDKANKAFKASQNAKEKAANDAVKQAQARFVEDFDIAQATVKFNERQRRNTEIAKKNAKILNDQAENARRAQFRNTALTAASAGLGILGPAGFPLLNVGFAAMSGGVMGAGIAAASTAIGEFTRAVNRLSDDSIQAAKQLGFVSMGFKEAEARMQAFQAFIGSGALTAQRVGMERRLENMRQQGPSALLFNQAWNSMSEGFWTTLTRPWDVASKGWARTYAGEVAGQSAQSTRGLLPDLESARRQMLIQMQQGMPGVENDPYQVWLRIQNAVLDPAKQEQMSLQRKQVELIDKEIEMLRNLNEFLRGPVQNTGMGALRALGVMISPGLAW